MIIGISGKIGSGKDEIAYIIQYLIAKYKPNGTPNLKYGEYYWSNNIGELITDVSAESGFKIVKFADKLKDMVCILLNCTREQLEDREFKEKELGEEWWYYKDKKGKMYPYTTYDGYTKEKELVALTPRLLLQLLGTECGRNIIHPNIWVNATFAEYKPQHFRTVKYQGSFVDHLTIMPNWIISDVRFPNEADVIRAKEGMLIRVNREKIKIQDDMYVNRSEYIKVNNITEHLSETALDNYEDWDYIIDNDGSIQDLIDKIKDILIKENII